MKDFDRAYKVNDVLTGYRYWKRKLVEKCMTIFKYSGLPENLPSHEIEDRLIRFGWCGVFKHQKYGIVTCNGSLSGIGLYDLPTAYTWTHPSLGSGTLNIERSAVIIYNSSIDQTPPRFGLMDIIERYARQLADIESSINIAVVNERVTVLASASTTQVAESIKTVRQSIVRGEYDVVNDPTMVFDNFKTVTNAEKSRSVIPDLMSARENTLKSFYNEIGVKTSIDKRERVIVDEVSSDDQMLLLNLVDMLDFRREAVKRINSKWGLGINIEINRQFEYEFTSSDGDDNE